MHEDTQYNVNCGAGEPTREEHLCCKERQGTCVMIRQKNLAFADSDCIYVLQKGNIVARGTDEQLKEQCELYRQLYGEEEK